MSILNEMGIQQWRLRPVLSDTAAEAVLITDANSDVSAILSSQSTVDVPTVNNIPYSIGSGAENNGTEMSVSLAVSQEANEDSNDSDTIEPSQQQSTPEPETSSIEPKPLAPNPVAVVPIPAPVPRSLTPAPTTALDKPAEPISDPIADVDWQGLQTLVDGQEQCMTCGADRSLLGAGDPNAKWLFLVDAPHSHDIQSQQLLSARAGQLFEAMLSAVGLERSSVYLTSVFKCVASDDFSKVPSCDKILHRQIELVRPEVVIAFGEFAAQSVIKANESLAVLRTSEQTCFRTKVPIIATYTPAQMLEESALKAHVWQDLKRCMSISPVHS